MRIIHKGNEYLLNPEAAIAAGIAVPTKINLELTLEQAVVLQAIVGRIGGSPEGARGRADAIRNKLDEKNVPSTLEGLDLSVDPTTSAIYFKK